MQNQQSLIHKRGGETSRSETTLGNVSTSCIVTMICGNI